MNWVTQPRGASTLAFGAPTLETGQAGTREILRRGCRATVEDAGMPWVARTKKGSPTDQELRRKFQAASEKQVPYSARCRLVLAGKPRLHWRSGMGAANVWQSFS